MCGICGIYNSSSGAPADTERIKRATDAMVHRGPDDAGVYADGNLALGNRRLSIIDLPGGHQPIANEDESVWITFNGEIYNYRELHSSLAARGHNFRTVSDTEVILHLYEERGVDCLESLRGIFAFALWDCRRRRLFVARDRLGVKPLFYRLSADGITFASELRALGELSSERFDADPQSIYDFFAFRYVPAPRTLFRDVEKLLPGRYLLADRDGVRTQSYWDVPVAEEYRGKEDDLAHEMLDCLRESVRLRLIADVPLGVFLSGGTDSSALVALMTELGARPLRTFSAGFSEPGYSELPYARSVAARYSTTHEEIVIHAADVASDLPRLIALRAEPVAEPTDVALYRLAQLAARSVKVALAGEGGDEVFAGYSKYAADRWSGMISRIPRAITRGIVQALPYRLRRGQLALEALSVRGEAERLATWFGSFSGHEREALFSREFLEQVDPGRPAKVFASYFNKNRTPLKRMLYADLKIWLPDNLLLRGDQMTMAASLEERVPFLDHNLVELAAKIPDSMLAPAFRPKAFFRRMMKGYLSGETLKRRKVGFAVPVAPWFRSALKPMVADLLLSPHAKSRGYFNTRNVERFVHEHFDGVRDRHKQLWALLNFELWQRG
ncbi:MAG: asparagine synthase (glutamine-hydrolyzing) [Terriglobia bacterium]